jgi:uroporphyrinogen-III decarboxylase
MGGAPFDMIADMLRGTQGVVMDMYRQPDKLQAAMEKVTPMAIKGSVAMADATGCPVCFMPLHKGDESFMSPKQFETFYWPTFKEVLMGLIDEGVVPFPFAEGRYGARLEVIADMPRSSVLWSFEDIDMARAKQVLGKIACIAGNVPASLMHAGTAAQVEEYVKKLIDTVGHDGGYALAIGAVLDHAHPETLHAFFETGRTYGVYR